MTGKRLLGFKRNWSATAGVRACRWPTSAIVFVALAIIIGHGLGNSADAQENAASAPQPASSEKAITATADHSQFEVLKQSFSSGPEVTKTCLGCHNQAAKQVHKTIHWNWQLSNERTGQVLGMRHVINNLFVSLASNEPFCTRCHIGFDWTDQSFDFSSEEQVDCLACHDTTGTYGLKRMHLRRAQCNACHIEYDPARVREVVQRPNFSELALNVGRPTRTSCGSCHFRSDGGDGVKHGDLDSSLEDPPREVDVHMSKNGLNFACVTCHEAKEHQVPGSRYLPVTKDVRGMDVVGGSRATCESCHGLAPHPEATKPKLNDHVDRVACQTCHIPAFARGGLPTKTHWDWSTAGRMDEAGKEIVKKDAQEHIVYSTKRGDGKWSENIIPDYVWFNGNIKHTTLEDSIDPTETVRLNTLAGSADDPQSRIWPVKTLRGKQPIDAGNATLAAVHLFGTDEGAFWKSFDWEKSVTAGMKAAGREFSGQMGFAETEMRIPINHMVAPKENALQCNDCHTKGGRLESLTGFYMPGRDTFHWLTILGWLAILGALAGAMGHAAMRVVFKLLRK